MKSENVILKIFFKYYKNKAGLPQSSRSLLTNFTIRVSPFSLYNPNFVVRFFYPSVFSTMPLPVPLSNSPNNPAYICCWFESVTTYIPVKQPVSQRD